MKHRFWLALGMGALLSLSAAAQEVTLTRLDCGTGANDPRRFSDTFAYTETTKPFTFALPAGGVALMPSQSPLPISSVAFFSGASCPVWSAW